MKIYRILGLFLILFPWLAFPSAWADGEEKADMLVAPTFSGFFDINASDFKERDNPWDIGPVELDLEWGYGENFSVAGALVFEDGAADVGVAFIDYHRFNHEISPRGRIFDNINDFHIQLGRFDVPFGLDYLYFATPDRETITPPLITDYIMDGGWNDDGARLYGSYKFLDYSVFTTNGFNEGLAYGGRVGFYPLRNPFRLHKEITDKLLEIGVSFAVDDSKKVFSQDENLLGFDGQFTLGPVEVRGEYIRRQIFTQGVTLSGFYGAVKYTFESFPVYTIVDYGEFKQTDFERAKRLSFGMTYMVLDYAAIKFEYLKYIDSDLVVFDGEVHDNTFSAKLVLCF